VGFSKSDPPDAAELSEAIDLAAGYLVRHCDEDGKFAYLIDLESERNYGPYYNLLRHAGTVHALASYLKTRPSPEGNEALERAARFLREKTLRPVPGREDLLAIWSDQTITSGPETKLKLGGAGLGLVAFISSEEGVPPVVSLEELRRLGDFILFMQKDDGSFYSIFDPAGGGRDDSWVSLYYPGEAALGLVMLYEKDPDPKWLQGAADAIACLARRREGEWLVESDHWALIATARLVPLLEELPEPAPREPILAHARQVCKAILYRKTIAYALMSAPEGASPDGRSCPTATMMEGLIAALDFLPSEDRALRERCMRTVNQGVGLLVEVQVKDGPRAGAIPRAAEVPYWAFFSKAGRERATEVRIDYVQHSLSAMLGADELYKAHAPDPDER